jgi:hypothetical protein
MPAFTRRQSQLELSMPSKKQTESASQVLEILTPEELGERLKLKPTTIYELTRRRCRNPLPAHRAGKVLRFFWTEVVDWLTEAKKIA